MRTDTRRWLESLAVAGRPDESESKQLLSLSGLAVPRSLRVSAATPAASAAAEAARLPLAPSFDGPYVVKVLSAEVLHKTDRGGVLLNVERGGLAEAAAEMRARFPGCALLIEEQVRYGGPEFIVGAFRDPAFGPAVMAGAGGILTELYKDVAFRLVPCTRSEALRMLKSLSVFPVLDGYRGLAMDPQGLCEAIAHVSDLVQDLGDRFSQLDINPIVFTQNGWIALDAKAILNE